MTPRRLLSDAEVAIMARDAERDGVAGMTVLQMCDGLHAAVLSECDRLMVLRVAAVGGIRRSPEILEYPMVRGDAA